MINSQDIDYTTIQQHRTPVIEELLILLSQPIISYQKAFKEYRENQTPFELQELCLDLEKFEVIVNAAGLSECSSPLRARYPSNMDLELLDFCRYYSVELELELDDKPQAIVVVGSKESQEPDHDEDKDRDLTTRMKRSDCVKEGQLLLTLYSKKRYSIVSSFGFALKQW